MKRLFWRISLISFGFAVWLSLAPGAGTTPPPITDFDLRAFGAVGDGVTDDGPALQSALDAIANAGGGTLIVPAGRYALVTPVVKDFSGLAGAVTIRGVGSSTVLNPKGDGQELTHGLDLTSEFVIKTGSPNIALILAGLGKLLITDMVFIGTPESLTDARMTLVISGIPDATVRHSEIYGLVTLWSGGAIIYADNSGLTIDQTAFLGSTGNSGVRNPVILTTNWKKINLTESVFVDYGQRPDYYGKLGLAPAFSWIMIGDAAPADSATPRRDATIRNVFMDEGAYFAITGIPDYYDQQAAPADLIYVSDFKVNVTNLGASGIYINRAAEHVLIERASFEWTHNADAAVDVTNVGDVVLDKLACIAAVNRIRASESVGKLTVLNSACTDIQSQAQSTSVLSTAPEDDPVQFVRHQFLGVLGVEPDGADHYNWSNLLLLCANEGCTTQRKNELATFLATPAIPSFLRYKLGYLFWQDNSFNETGFKIEYFDPGPGAWTQIATVSPEVTAYKVGLNSSPICKRYRILAFNSTGDSAYSNEACASNVMYFDTSPQPSFSDDFDDNSLDAGLWAINNFGTPSVTEQSEQLQLTLAPNTAGYNGIDSVSTFDLTSRMVQVEVAQPVNQGGWCENFIKVALDGNNYFLIDVGSGSMVIRSMAAGVNNQTVIWFDPALHRHWRIRHDQVANTINFETSADNELWTTRKTAAVAFPLTSLRFSLGAGAWGTGNGTPGAAKYDNFKLLPGTTGTDVRIPNYGFESPAVGNSNFQYGPTGASWSFISSAGVTGNGSGFTGGLNIAPQGNQAAFLQAGSTSVISQSVAGFQANRTYIVSFAAAQRSNCCNYGGQDFQVYLDESLLGTFHPASGSYAYYSTPTFTTTAGLHTLKFVGLNSLGGDHSAFIDDLRVTLSTGW